MATAKARAEEAQRAAVAFSYGLNVLGAQATAEALAAWQDVPATPNANPARWLDRIIRALIPVRRRSRHLARTYYRLTRALHTGATIQDDVGTVEDETTLGKLRQDFSAAYRSAVRPPAGSVKAAPPKTTEGPRKALQEPPEPPGEGVEDDDDDRILVEEIRGLEAEAERIEREAEDEMRNALEALGTSNLRKKIAVIDDSLPASEVDKLRQRAKDEAGARQGAAAGRVIKNGARSDIWSAAERDRKVLGYIRLSRTGTPCGWCAMLISRGPVYKSSRSAQFDEGDMYHDNCNCYAEPVWSREQYDNSDLYALNREYSKLWPQVTRGLSGKQAVAAWRRYFRQRAQVAQGTAQEA